ncbi:hypothetical protein CRG98_021020 [Punica granatum]|uniref:Uncharacterized protein n=1 Tax=Punica granatum TaxID=22663 RepID=A0A2I0JQI6_PUNGR|nr:hypothetical protein CRG98_021020 [Punica granatum]
MNYRRKAGATRKVQRAMRGGRQTTNLGIVEVDTVALFITGSPKLQKSCARHELVTNTSRSPLRSRRSPSHHADPLSSWLPLLLAFGCSLHFLSSRV